jgi:FkbM family methyltransferase
MFIRSLVERTARSASFRRSLPASVGGAQIYASVSGGLKYLFKPMESVDPGLCRLAREFVQRGHVVWDVGANVGLFSFAAAHLAGEAGKVFAFDADTWIVQLLRRSAAIQPSTSAPVEIIPAAVADSCNVRTFNIAVRSRASNYLQGYGQSQTGGVAERQTVICVSMDWLSERLPPPDVVKIDVEGAELEVLRGGIGLFQSKHPIVLCEVSAQSSPEVTVLLNSIGYTVYDGEALPTDRQALAAAPWNTVAIRR